ncbi:MAG: hypothetical protein A2885_18830 [Sphingopyxis sp. RIFCSPHIGHO2_01_FULL_65_24]|nr:MAG: hypothetical protein A2885_18830 [Sphingopyxis sp. RIFCSPHIGHO2_01_FULL_65_24]
MLNRFLSGRAKLLSAFAALMLLIAPTAAQAAKWFVDNTLGDVKAEDKKTPATPKPVQLIFEFQRNGEPNPRATKEVKPWIIESLKGTGAFSEVAEAPVAGGAVLSITFNNIVPQKELDKAKKDAFGAGLGFGLFGGVVATDRYDVTFEYLPGEGAPSIKTLVQHALHMKYGKKEVEIPGTQVKNVTEAVKTVVRQATDHGVNNLVSDPAFPQ